MLILGHSSSPARVCLEHAKVPLRSLLNKNPQHVFVTRRRYAIQASSSDGPTGARTRNIGIIAHIDAGKTTTTERMLYYSGYTRRIGDVDDGSTVTDFLPAERARGITIQSAAITFEWPPKPLDAESSDLIQKVQQNTIPRSAISHSINLIDTPGHADFTFEVRRSLRILDGAVCILDGVAGVEAQTEQVWKQAGEWQIPRIVYINKLDRDGAAFARTVHEVGSRLGGWPAVCQIPWWEGGRGRFTGIGDVVNMQGLLYPEAGDGKTIRALSLTELTEVNAGLAAELERARTALIELLSEHDETMVEHFLEANEDHLAVSPIQVLSSLRRCLLDRDGKVVPVFAGASFRNIGVQPLLDAVVNLLPTPQERPDAEIRLGSVHGTLGKLLQGNVTAFAPKNDVPSSRRKGAGQPSLSLTQSFEGCALAFKVVHDARKGVLVYFRVYSGSIQRGAMLYNTNLNISERATNLLRMYASDSVPVQSIEAGQIGVFAGSKYARTGDTLIAYAGSKATPPEPLNLLQLRPIEVPPPVFFASIEPNSLREEKDMHDKLALLLREDPSLHVTQDEDTGQTLLSGMGELHLEIARDRLVNDLKSNATMGKIEIGYRQTVQQASSQMLKIYDGDAAGSKGKAGCNALVEPLDLSEETPRNTSESDNFFLREQDGNVIVILAPTLDHKGRPISSDDQGLPQTLPLAEIQSAFFNGALAALSRGPVHTYPMRNIKLTLTLNPEEHLFGNDTMLSALSSAARFATIAAVKDAAAKGGSLLMEPVMDVTISVDETNLGSVVNDISSSRGGHIVSLDEDGDPSRSSEDEEKSAIDVRKIYAPPDPFGPTGGHQGQSDMALSNRPRVIKAKVPLKEMVGYLKHLRSITGGRGTFVMSVDRFEKMSGQRERQLLLELRG